ncbi:MAG: pentapeptide repeat-containing protein [Ignavibacteria bacterium]|nr:pentapeptide repeat-containing protein [Ignavibacteria bacterium]
MALSNKPKKSLYQVGETVYILNGVLIASGKIVKVSSSVSNPLNDTNGLQENLYYIEGFVQPFKEGEVFHSKNALLFKLKGEYLAKFKSTALVYLEALSDFDLSFSDFSGTAFDGASFISANLEGVNFSNCGLNVNFENTNLKNCIFTGCEFGNFSFIGANLTGATLPASANTKSTFKSVVGAGNWDPVTTIWTDGLPIGN